MGRTPSMLLSVGLFLCALTTQAKPYKMQFYVATTGDDAWSGTLPAPNAKHTDGPFATLLRARQAVRANKSKDAGGATVSVRGGAYPQAQSFALTSEDSGSANAPVVYMPYKNEAVRIIGGRDVTGWQAVTDESVLKRMDAPCRGRVLQTDLKAQGITAYGRVQPDGWDRPAPPLDRSLELFFDGRPMTLARWPNQGFAQIADAPKQTTGTFTYEADKVGERAARWAQDGDAWLHGYWMFDWADSYLPLKSVDGGQHTLTVPPPADGYGISKGKRFYVLNALSELDSPGEWYLDRNTGVLYFWPPSPLNANSAVTVSTLDAPLISLQNASYITIQGMTLEATKGVAVEITGGAHNLVAGCTIRNTGLAAARLEGGSANGVQSCDIYETGQGGVSLNGGDRKTLAAAGNFAANNAVHDYSRWVRCYRPAVSVNGVGNRVTHNLIYSGPHNAIQLSGNEHLVEYNEVHDVCRETGDVGAFYMGRDWTMRGNVVRFNYFHNLGGPKAGFGGEGFFDAMGVYLDDAASGATVYGNIFYKAGRGVLLGGGRDNKILDNLFVDCNPSMHVDARGTSWAKKYIGAGGEWGMYDKLNAVNYKQPPYSVRYPKLTTIEADNPAFPSGNEITGNSSFGGKWIELQDGLTEKTAGASENNVDEKPTDMQTALSSWLTKSGESGSRNRLHSLSMIGLVRDAYRKIVPVQKAGIEQGKRQSQ